MLPLLLLLVLLLWLLLLGEVDLTAGTDVDINAANAVTVDAGADQNITLTTSGTGRVVIPLVDINGGAIDAVTLGTNSVVTQANIDNIQIDNNTISSTDAGGNIVLDPNGAGIVDVNSSLNQQRN